MGFFSKLWKGVKNVFKGILKIFEPILKPLGKLMNSKFGKALMIGLSIFTLGSAMVAGYGAFMANVGNGFVSAFVEGGKAFLSTLTGIGGKEGATGTADKIAGKTGEGIVQTSETMTGLTEGTSAMVEGATQAGSAGLEGGGMLKQGQDLAMQSGASAMGGGQSGSIAFGPGETGDVMRRSVQSGGTGAGQGAMLPEMAGDTSKLAELTKGSTEGSKLLQAEGKGHWLSEAAEAGKKFTGNMFGKDSFMRSEGGGQIVGSLIQGAGNYYTEKDRQEFEDRIRRDWMRGDNNPNIRALRQQGVRAGNLAIPSAQDIASASRATANQNARRPYFQRPYGATAGGGG